VFVCVCRWGGRRTGVGEGRRERRGERSISLPAGGMGGGLGGLCCVCVCVQVSVSVAAKEFPRGSKVLK
jgi:hypothetical protein